MTKIRDFDKVAGSWDEEPRRVKVATEIATAIKNTLSLSTGWDAMDIGCGTGLVTVELAPYVGSITGIDSSCAMLEQLGEKVKASGNTNIKTALCDLSAGQLPEGKFHLIVSAMTLHHIKDPETLLSSLISRLYPGGWIALADLEAEDGSFHEDPTGVFHHGFSRTALTTLLESSGYVAISITKATIMQKGDRTYPVLLAVAQS
ncbi:MAG TPA: class I SAM-dependent methyltransferase [Desulfuromonadales bacterium]|nr:class I SAM-dependent methyltransferase [Desulfuromonadales bacterium]